VFSTKRGKVVLESEFATSPDEKDLREGPDNPDCSTVQALLRT
jgi:hypothetical protein